MNAVRLSSPGAAVLDAAAQERVEQTECGAGLRPVSMEQDECGTGVSPVSYVPLPGKLLQNKVAVISGASRGIGRATALRLAEAGARLVVNYFQNQPAARQTVEQAQALGAEAIAVQADSADLCSAEKLCAAALREFGSVDVVVANAGIWQGEPIGQMREGLWDRVLEQNLKSTWALCRAAVPLMQQRGGAIVIVSSTAGQRGEAGYSGYAASKGGQISFAKSLAAELAPNIRVNCVAPGWVETELNGEVFAQPGFRERARQAIPLQRIAEADDVATAIAFLASDWARHITGEVLNVNGGAVMCG